MQILVINLDSQPDRLEHFAGQMAAFGLPFTRIAAVNGRALAPGQIADGRAFAPEFYALGEGEIACFLSHRAAWQRFLDHSSDPCCCVFEDDIHLSADAKPFLQDCGWLPAEADIVKLETVRQPTRLDKSAAATFGGRQVRRLRAVHPGGGAYVLTRETARLLLDTTARYADAVDQVMFNPALREKSSGGRYGALASLRIFQVEDAVAIQDSVLAKSGAPIRNLDSFLRIERRTHKRKLDKLVREITRPFARFATGFARMLSGMTTDKAWRKIAFR